MSIRQKAARLIMTHISDRAWDDFGDECRRLERDIKELGVGGFCLFGGNVDRTPELIAAMRELAAQAFSYSKQILVEEYLGGWKEVEYEVVRELMARGHRIEFSRGPYGGYQAIMKHPDFGTYYGASESRKDGHAAGY